MKRSPDQPWQFHGISSLILMAALLCAGCAAEFAEAPSGNVCQANSDCPSNQICQRGACGVVQEEPRKLGFTLLPPTDSNFRPQVVPASEMRISDAVTIGLESSVFVKGTIHFRAVDGTGADRAGPEGTLLFQRPSGEDLGYGAQTHVTSEGEFSIHLRPGRYDVTLIPDARGDDGYPTVVWEDQNFTLDTQQRYLIPAKRELIDISGQITPAGVPARITAISRDTGFTSTTTTSDIDGRFFIRVLPREAEYTLEIAPALTNGVVPEVTVDHAFEVSNDGQWKNLSPEGADEMTIDLGDYQPMVTVPVDLRLEVAGENTVEDWSGTNVALESMVGEGRLTLSGTVTPDGRVIAAGATSAGNGRDSELQVIPGRYRVEVTPPASLLAGSRTFEDVDLLEPLTPAARLTLPPREVVEGTLLTPEGVPAASARVEMHPRHDGPNQPLVVETDDQGQFRVWLEESTEYRITFKPGKTSRARRTDFVDLEELRSLLASPVTLPEPAVIFGTVLGTPGEGADAPEESWKPVADVSIQAFEERRGDRVVLGEGHTDEQGEFRLVIPAK